MIRASRRLGCARPDPFIDTRAPRSGADTPGPGDLLAHPMHASGVTGDEPSVQGCWEEDMATSTPTGSASEIRGDMVQEVAVARGVADDLVRQAYWLLYAAFV